MDTAPNLGLALAAVVLATVTALVTLAYGWQTRPREPNRGPSTDDLGPEPTAIVNFLTEDFAVTPAAVPATMLDLAVRSWLTVEDVGAGNVLIRLGRHRSDDVLSPYEQRVLEHLASLAVGGVVPAAAMTTGTDDASTRWWRAFRREVIADAHRRGLSRDRFPGSALAVPRIGLVACIAALWVAGQGGSGSGPNLATWLWVGGLLLTVLVGASLFMLSGRDLQRDTDAGRAAASRWLGVRDYLRTVGDFDDKPAASVVVWDRYLAVAVAMGLAPTALAQLPFGSEDHRRAWSSATGSWRRVVVRYPRFRPGYGQHPVLAGATALAVGFVAVLVLAFAARVVRGDVTAIADLPAGARRLVDWIAAGTGIVAVAAIGWNVLKLLAAVGDLVQVDTVSGILLRRRVRWGMVGLHEEAETSDGSRTRNRYFCALDSGRAPTVAAWRVRPTIYAAAHEGDRCSARVTRHLHYVRSLDPATPHP